MKFHLIRRLLSLDDCKKRVEVMNNNIGGPYEINDNECKISNSFYGINCDLSPTILKKYKELTNKNLAFTYDYCRIYSHGEILSKHIDRRSCEYSVTVNFYNESDPWNIYMISDDKRTDITMQPGDALFYKGIEVIHGRDKNQGGKVYQGFFHFVDLNGPYEKFKNEYIEKKHILLKRTQSQ